METKSPIGVGLLSDIKAIVNDDTRSESFKNASIYVSQIRSPTKISQVFEQLQNELEIYLSSISISSIQSYKEAWDRYQNKINAILPIFLNFESFSKTDPRVSVLNTQIAAWKKATGSKIGKSLSSQIEGIISNVTKPFEAIIPPYRDFLSVKAGRYRIFISDISVRYLSEFNSLGLTPEEKLQKIIPEIDRLCDIAALEELQDLILLPLIKSLLSTIHESSELLLLVPVYETVKSERIKESLINITDEFIGSLKTPPTKMQELTTLLKKLALLFDSETSAKRIISHIINRNGTNFYGKVAEEVMLSDSPPKVADLISLAMDADSLQTEMTRALNVRILCNGIEDKEQYWSLLQSLTFLPESFHQNATKLIESCQFYGNFMVSEKLFWTKLLEPCPPMFPECMREDINRFSANFKKNNPSKQLEFSVAFSKAFVKIKYDKTEVHVEMTVLQYNILTMLANGETNFKGLGIGNGLLNAALRPLIMAGFIEKDEKDFSIMRSPPKKKKYITYNFAVNVHHITEKKADGIPHKSPIRSVLAKIAKRAGLINEDELVRNAIQELSSLLKASEDEVKNEIDSMVDEEYLYRNPNNKSLISYLDLGA